MNGHERRTPEARHETGRHGTLAGRDIPEFQRALLPAGLPVLPRLRIAARFVAVSAEDRSSASWFDAIALPDGTAALTIGDAIGSGIGAVASMGQLRAALNERFGTGADLSTVQSMADDFAVRTAGLAGATMALAMLSPQEARLRYLTCGNPPPVILRAGASPEFLDGTGHGPLGSGGAPCVGTAQLDPGDVVLLCNLGVIDRPGRSVSQGMAEFGEAAADAVASRRPARSASGPADRACQLADELLDRSGYTEDVSILAAEVLDAAPPSLRLSMPADIGGLRPARAQFDEWLIGAGTLSPDLENLQLAVGEIMTNAVIHAYPSGTHGTIELRADLRPDGTVECQVTDQGIWKAPDLTAAAGGNGLMVASRIIDELYVHHPVRSNRAGGTVVTLRHRLTRPASLGSVASAVNVVRHPAMGVRVTREAEAAGVAAAVTGPVDSTTADRLMGRLLAASRGGTLPLVVDLSLVTYFDSAGVWALCQVSDQLAAQGQELTLVAPRSSSAQPMLELAALAHQADAGQLSGQHVRSADG